MKKNIPVTLLKLSIAGGLLYWLTVTGQLDFKEAGETLRDINTLAALFLSWLCGSVILGALRWREVLKVKDVKISFLLALKLQLIGFFFNVAMPGAIGGDIIKSVYVIRSFPKANKPEILYSALIDRIVGLFGLLAIGLFFFAINVGKIENKKLFLLAGFLATVFIVGCTGIGFLWLLGRFRSRKIIGLLPERLSFIKKVSLSLTDYLLDRKCFLICLLISITIQSANLIVFWYLFGKFGLQSVLISDVGLIFPIGIMATVIPVSPGGLGVGHAAFEHLTLLLGFSGGANVYNVFVLSQFALNLVGFIPFIMYRTEIEATKKDVLSP